ncbi:acid protease [Hyaloscypha variabilis F]|uniref:Acid protease n=1 Tax=Hyaloscypha variabilis (strain UAMH 11265 / GT02V1 / F) TaxID=1149755 RepID=A0A2J6RFW4_HYAVF|nr:acid protease [Hyaloscypha variabilis F]
MCGWWPVSFPSSLTTKVSIFHAQTELLEPPRSFSILLFKMLFSTFALSSFLSLSTAWSIPRRQDAPYVYIPVEFLYGADSRVTTNITFGTSQPITVVMDTGSSDAWIWQAGAIVHWGSPFLFDPGPCNLTVPSTLTYSPLLSPTSHTQNKTSEYVYASNSKIVQGILYSNDTLTFPTNTSTTLPNTQLALENSAILRLQDNGSCTPPPSYDKGIIGLANFINANATQGPSFRQNLFDTSAIKTKTLVTWFDTPPSALSTLSGGLLLGAIDTSKFLSPLVRVPNVVTTGQIGYYIPKPNITFNGQSFVPDQNTTCLLDSGTHADYLPFNPVGGLGSAFFNASSGMLINENGVVAYNGSCEGIPSSLNITYTFTGATTGESVKIDVPLRNYARGASSEDGQICLLNLDVGGCTFGAPFFSGAVVAVDDGVGVLALAQGGVSEVGSGVDEATLKVFEVGETFDYD